MHITSGLYFRSANRMPSSEVPSRQTTPALYFGVRDLAELRRRASTQEAEQAEAQQSQDNTTFESLWPGFEARLSEDITGEGDTGLDILAIVKQLSDEGKQKDVFEEHATSLELSRLYPRSAKKVVAFLHEVGSTYDGSRRSYSEGQKKLIACSSTSSGLSYEMFKLTNFGKWVLANKVPSLSGS